MSIRSSTVVNRSAAVMNRSGPVDESRRHRRSIVRHRIDAGFPFFIPMHPEFTLKLKSGRIVMNRSRNRECVTGAIILTSRNVLT